MFVVFYLWTLQKFTYKSKNLVLNRVWPCCRLATHGHNGTKNWKRFICFFYWNSI